MRHLLRHQDRRHGSLTRRRLRIRCARHRGLRIGALLGGRNHGNRASASLVLQTFLNVEDVEKLFFGILDRSSRTLMK